MSPDYWTLVYLFLNDGRVTAEEPRLTSYDRIALWRATFGLGGKTWHILLDTRRVFMMASRDRHRLMVCVRSQP